MIGVSPWAGNWRYVLLKVDSRYGGRQNGITSEKKARPVKHHFLKGVNAGHVCLVAGDVYHQIYELSNILQNLILSSYECMQSLLWTKNQRFAGLLLQYRTNRQIRSLI